MWRATVVQQIHPGSVVVRIPDLYRDDLVGPIPSSVEAEPGEQVFVTDVAPQSKARALMVIGYQSMIGRWGTAYAHTHPTGQITGVTDTGVEATLTEILAGKAGVGDIPDLSGYATTTDLSTGMSGKADTPGPWVNCTPSTYIFKEEGADIQVRTVPGGIELRSGRWRYTSDVPRDSTIFTMPTGYAPPWVMYFLASAMSSAANNYDAITVHLEARTNGAVRARSGHQTSPLITLNQILLF